MTAGEVDMIEVAEVDLTDLIAEEEITNTVSVEDMEIIGKNLALKKYDEFTKY